MINDLLIYYYKNVKKLDYFTITIDGQIKEYVFRMF